MTNVFAKLRRSKPHSGNPVVAEAVPRTRLGVWLGRPMTSFHLIIAVEAGKQE